MKTAFWNIGTTAAAQSLGRMITKLIGNLYGDKKRP